jgi:hypothetical protein
MKHEVFVIVGKYVKGSLKLWGKAHRVPCGSEQFEKGITLCGIELTRYARSFYGKATTYKHCKRCERVYNNL